MLLKDFLRPYRKYNNFDGDIGLEIETETKLAYDVPELFFWNTVVDNSLRDFGMEYVLKQPVKFSLLRDALEEFEAKTNKIDFIQDSFSTSVHVHLNILNENLVTIGSFLTAYTLVENLLVKHSGDNRLSNLFCLPIKDAEDTYRNMVNIVQGFSSKNFRSAVIAENAAKYGALNLAALAKYGSLEIRSFRGVTNPEVIYQWTATLYGILEYARKINPRKIMEDYQTSDMKVIEKILGEDNPILKIDNAKELVEQNVYFAARVAAAVLDWDALNVEEKRKTPTKAQLNTYAVNLYNKQFESLSAAEQYIVLDVADKEVNSPFYKKTRGRKAPVAMDDMPEFQPVAVANPLIHPGQINNQAGF